MAAPVDDSVNGFFVGLESGATRSRYILLNNKAELISEIETEGFNSLLAGVAKTGDVVATNVRLLVKKGNVNLPVKALGMGMAGAENPIYNQEVIDYIKQQHGDIADYHYLTTDSVAAIAANFPINEGGIVLIAGTGSAARLLLSSGEVHCVGGWGHLISDGGGAYWIGRRAIQQLFDIEDGLEESSHSTEPLQKALFDHYNITDKTHIFNVLYVNKNVKKEVASFCETLAKLAETDSLAAEQFYAAGYLLGQHVTCLARHSPKDDLSTGVNVLIIGSVFKSWPLLKSGFHAALRASKTPLKVRLAKPSQSPALGAALLAAYHGQSALNYRIPSTDVNLLDVLDSESASSAELT